MTTEALVSSLVKGLHIVVLGMGLCALIVGVAAIILMLVGPIMMTAHSPAAVGAYGQLTGATGKALQAVLA